MECYWELEYKVYSSLLSIVAVDDESDGDDGLCLLPNVNIDSDGPFLLTLLLWLLV